jgi:general stress protein 26
VSEPTTTLDPRFSDAGAEPTAWDDTVRALETAELFWITTVRADGRPHVSPLVAVWLDGAIHFSTGPTEQKALNLRANPHVILTTGCNQWDRGLDVVIEGDAARVTEPGALARIAKAWADNGWPAEPDDSGSGITAPFNAPSQGPPPWNVYRIEPRSAIVTLAEEPGGLTRFLF